MRDEAQKVRKGGVADVTYNFGELNGHYSLDSGAINEVTSCNNEERSSYYRSSIFK